MKYIVTCTTPQGVKLVFTHGNKWAHHYPGVNEYLWRKFDAYNDAECTRRMKTIDLNKMHGEGKYRCQVESL